MIKELSPFRELPTSISVELDGAVYEFDHKTISDLASIAIRNKLDYASAILVSVANEAFLLEEEAQGAKLIIERNGRMNELVRS